MIMTTATAQGNFAIEFDMPRKINHDGSFAIGIGNCSKSTESPDFWIESMSIRTRRTIREKRMARITIQPMIVARPI
jgi:hypothetical protein